MSKKEPTKVKDIDLTKVDNNPLGMDDDFDDVVAALEKVTYKYVSIGHSLRINFSNMKLLEETHGTKFIPGLRAMVAAYLSQGYDIDKHGPPTWRKIVAAVSNSMGGNNHALAKEIALKFHVGYRKEQSPAQESSVAHKDVTPRHYDPNNPQCQQPSAGQSGHQHYQTDPTNSQPHVTPRPDARRGSAPPLPPSYPQDSTNQRGPYRREPMSQSRPLDVVNEQQGHMTGDHRFGDRAEDSTQSVPTSRVTEPPPPAQKQFSTPGTQHERTKMVNTFGTLVEHTGNFQQGESTTSYSSQTQGTNLQGASYSDRNWSQQQVPGCSDARRTQQQYPPGQRQQRYERTQAGPYTAGNEQFSRANYPSSTHQGQSTQMVTGTPGRPRMEGQAATYQQYKGTDQTAHVEFREDCVSAQQPFDSHGARQPPLQPTSTAYQVRGDTNLPPSCHQQHTSYREERKHQQGQPSYREQHEQQPSEQWHPSEYDTRVQQPSEFVHPVGESLISQAEMRRRTVGVNMGTVPQGEDRPDSPVDATRRLPQAGHGQEQSFTSRQVFPPQAQHSSPVLNKRPLSASEMDPSMHDQYQRSPAPQRRTATQQDPVHYGSPAVTKRPEPQQSSSPMPTRHPASQQGYKQSPTAGRRADQPQQSQQGYGSTAPGTATQPPRDWSSHNQQVSTPGRRAEPPHQPQGSPHYGSTVPGTAAQPQRGPQQMPPQDAASMQGVTNQMARLNMNTNTAPLHQQQGAGKYLSKEYMEKQNAPLKTQTQLLGFVNQPPQQPVRPRTTEHARLDDVESSQPQWGSFPSLNVQERLQDQQPRSHDQQGHSYYAESNATLTSYTTSNPAEQTISTLNSYNSSAYTLSEDEHRQGPVQNIDYSISKYDQHGFSDVETVSQHAQAVPSGLPPAMQGATSNTVPSSAAQPQRSSSSNVMPQPYGQAVYPSGSEATSYPSSSDPSTMASYSDNNTQPPSNYHGGNTGKPTHANLPPEYSTPPQPVPSDRDRFREPLANMPPAAINSQGPTQPVYASNTGLPLSRESYQGSYTSESLTNPSETSSVESSLASGYESQFQPEKPFLTSSYSTIPEPQQASRPTNVAQELQNMGAALPQRRLPSSFGGQFPGSEANYGNVNKPSMQPSERSGAHGTPVSGFSPALMLRGNTAPSESGMSEQSADHLRKRHQPNLLDDVPEGDEDKTPTSEYQPENISSVATNAQPQDTWGAVAVLTTNRGGAAVTSHSVIVPKGVGAVQPTMPTIEERNTLTSTQSGSQSGLSDVGGERYHEQCSSIPSSMSSIASGAEENRTPQESAKPLIQVQEPGDEPRMQAGHPSSNIHVRPIDLSMSGLSAVGGATEHAQCSSMSSQTSSGQGTQQLAIQRSNLPAGSPMDVGGSTHQQQATPETQEADAMQMPFAQYYESMCKKEMGEKSRTFVDGVDKPYYIFEPFPREQCGPPYSIKLSFGKIDPVADDRHMSQYIDLYEMGRRPHGLAVIINNQSFDNKSKHRFREGTEVDEKNLIITFRYLGYRVEVHRNLTMPQMCDLFEDVKSRDHQDYDSFVCCILTHGERGGKVVGSDSQSVLIETLTGHLCATNCTTLKGKPKMFFIQACRGLLKCRMVSADGSESGQSDGEGDALDGAPDVASGLPAAHQDGADAGFELSGEVDGTRTSHDAEDTQILRRSIVRSLSREYPRIEADSEIPDATDFFFGYATPSGHVAWRDLDHGSWYVSELCRALCMYSVVLPLNDIMAKVHNGVGERYYHENFKQAPETTTRLRFKVYF